ncbi:gp113 [Bacillus phage G]|uniref:Gp113 n=1 Tax=Bacillus phage G TaxID=2884420 RepID=G3MBH5_9CAUD|nr:gp113 [Bacillus phage G]AEO93375.1 gp113 [Bacillus phage G]
MEKIYEALKGVVASVKLINPNLSDELELEYNEIQVRFANSTNMFYFIEFEDGKLKVYDYVFLDGQKRIYNNVDSFISHIEFNFSQLVSIIEKISK